MPGDYIKDHFLKKLVDPNERNKLYSRKSYFNLRNQVIGRLVREFGSNPAWITLFGSILSSAFFINWLLAISFWSSNKNTNETEHAILNALDTAGLPSMIAFFMILFLALFVALFSIATSVDQYKIRKGLNQRGGAQPQKVKPDSPTSNGANGDTVTLASLRSTIYLGINFGISLALIAHLFAIAYTMSRGTNDTEAIPLLLMTVFLLATTIYHAWTLTGKNKRFKKRWVFASFAGFILVLGAFLGIAAYSRSLIDAIALAYLLFMTGTLLWLATNGVAYQLASIDAKANKTKRTSSPKEDTHTLSRWMFRDITVFGIVALLEFPLMFLVETYGCRLLVLSFDLLYSFTSLILGSV